VQVELDTAIGWRMELDDRGLNSRECEDEGEVGVLFPGNASILSAFNDVRFNKGGIHSLQCGEEVAHAEEHAGCGVAAGPHNGAEVGSGRVHTGVEQADSE